MSRGRINTVTKETIDLLIARFPAAFSNADLRKPLKIGIDAGLRLALPEADPRRLRSALAVYTSDIRYLRGLFAIGAVRVDLSGAVIEVVSPEAAKHAVQQLADRRARRAATVRADYRAEATAALRAAGVLK